MIGASVRVIGFAGWSGAGKTTLLRRLIPVLVDRKLAVSTIKHAHHGFDIDQPGKDSWEHRQAGATEVVVASARRWALMHELRDAPEPDLVDLLGRLTPVDLVLIEGFKRGPHRKIEVHRRAIGKPFLYPSDPTIVAVATDAMEPLPVHTVSIDDVASVAELVLQHAQPMTRWECHRGSD